jgi:hypothetical protein
MDDVFIDPGWLDAWHDELAGLEWLLVGIIALFRWSKSASGSEATGSKVRRVPRSL